MQRKVKPIRGRAEPRNAIHEWVGGRLTAPFYVTQPTPFRPEVILWYEKPQDLILAVDLIDPSKPVSFGDSLLEAMCAPKVGAPRRPRSIRVNDAQLAAELRAVAGDIPIRVAPTPELDMLLEMFVQQNRETEVASYFEGGRIPPESIARLFEASRYLWTIAPWKTIYDGQVIRLDVPEYDVHGAAISIIGHHKTSFGFLIFPSLEGYEAFERFAEKHDGGERFDFGTTFLSLDYTSGTDLPVPMRDEIKRNKWPIAANKAYPIPGQRDRDGLLRPLSQRDVDILAATAVALGTFYTKSADSLHDVDAEPVSLTISDENDIDVRFTYPYEAFALFGDEKTPSPTRTPGKRPAANVVGSNPMQSSPPLFAEPPHAGARVAKIGRNEPCPCGSGKKYKRCHLETDEASRGVAPARIHAFDEQR